MYIKQDAVEIHKNQNLLNILSKNHGILLLKNINNPGIAINISANLGTIYHPSDANPLGVTTISNLEISTNQENVLAFTEKMLYPHTDRSPLNNPPNFLLNWLVSQSIVGGNTLLCDGKKVFEHLKKHHPDSLTAFCKSDAAIFSDTIDQFTGPIFEVNKNEFVSIRFRRDKYIQFKKDYHKHAHHLYDAIDQHTINIASNPGDGYLINNKRWLHGRTDFTGCRVVKRIQIYKTPQ